MSTSSVGLSSAQLLPSSTPALSSVLFTSSYLSRETVSFAASVSPTPSTVNDTLLASSTVTIPTTPDQGTMKRFIVYMTITNRSYDVMLNDKESNKFGTFSKKVEDSVKTALEEVEGFVYSKVERFSEGNDIDCQMTVFVKKTVSVTEEKIREKLGNKIGDLEITGVIVVDTTLPTKEAPTAEEEIVFEVTVTIPDKEFTEELSDSTSPKFKELAAQLKAILTDVLKKKFANFLRTEITGFSNGSIICKFNVITAQGSTTSDEDIKDALTEASNKNETKGFTFTQITVEKKVASEKPRTGDKETTFPDWVIVVIAAFGVMVLLIVLMVYLIFRKRRIHHHALDFLDTYDNIGIALEDFHERKMTVCQQENGRTE